MFSQLQTLKYYANDKKAKVIGMGNRILVEVLSFGGLFLKLNIEDKEIELV